MVEMVEILVAPGVVLGAQRGVESCDEPYRLGQLLRSGV